MIKLYHVRQYIELLEVFTIREIKSRYKASLLGPLWIVISPLVTALVLSFIFGNLIKIRSDNVPYFLFVLSGLIIWNFFQQGMDLSKESLVWNRELITKTAFPKDTLPLSYIFSKIPDFLVYVGIFLVFYLLNGYRLDISIVFLFTTLIPLTLFCSGIALIISLAHAVFRDFGRLAELMITLLFYTSPIIYPESLVPQKYKAILFFNPLTSLIVLIRELLFSYKIRLDLFFTSLVVSFLIFLAGLLIFKKFSKKIPDLI